MKFAMKLQYEAYKTYMEEKKKEKEEGKERENKR